MTTPRPLVIAFDMDDTLFEEMTYVRSGFRAAAQAAADLFGVDPEEAFEVVITSLERDGRGRQFDVLAAHCGRPQKKWVRALIDAYRRHTPTIAPSDDATLVLDALSDRSLYLVTDGHKEVQRRKLEALGIAGRFKHCYLTNRYGRRHQKPSPRVFELLCRREGCEPGDVVYVGDNPTKDFCGIRPLGFRTIRVLQGNHGDVVVAPARDAEVSVGRLREVLDVLETWERERK